MDRRAFDARGPATLARKAVAAARAAAMARRRVARRTTVGLSIRSRISLLKKANSHLFPKTARCCSNVDLYAFSTASDT